MSVIMIAFGTIRTEYKNNDNFFIECYDTQHMLINFEQPIHQFSEHIMGLKLLKTDYEIATVG